MTQITAAAVKALREQTGLGMMECKKALVAADGDLDAARETLRVKSGARADAIAGRAAAEGAVAVCAGEARAALVEISSETDFVAREPAFIEFAHQTALAAAAQAPKEFGGIDGLRDRGRTNDRRRAARARGANPRKYFPASFCAGRERRGRAFSLHSSGRENRRRACAYRRRRCVRARHLLADRRHASVGGDRCRLGARLCRRRAARFRRASARIRQAARHRGAHRRRQTQKTPRRSRSHRATFRQRFRSHHRRVARAKKTLRSSISRFLSSAKAQKNARTTSPPKSPKSPAASADFSARARSVFLCGARWLN